MRTQQQSLPVIDLSQLQSTRRITETSNVHASNRDLEQVARDVERALKRSGFFYIHGHGIERATVERLLQSQQIFFDQPLSVKKQYAIDQNNRGYLGFGEAKMRGAQHHDLKEVFFFGRELAHDDPDLVAGLPLCAVNRWPHSPASLKADVLSYLDAACRVGDQLLRAIALCFGVQPNFFEPFYQRPMSRGQLIHYPAPNENSQQFGVAEHSDFGCITLLHQGSPGLEVRTRDDHWIDAPPLSDALADALVVNIGDLLERWTGARAPSTRHRVRNTTGVSRYSIAIFYDPSPNAVIDPSALDPDGSSDALVDYPPVTASDYILNASRGVFAQFK